MNFPQLADQPRLSAFHMACTFPRDPEFRAFICEHRGLSNVSADCAAHVIREMCGIGSRNELKGNIAAAHRFETLVRRPFVAYRDRINGENR
ncbi:hypothetical protein [Burkholderia gladioli]|uniref:hypothetical protein n=1 Tax=Burkholderia gladioli TaxID=28095 RepID=UPI00163E7A6D|nr:hypothetical protein [Burkholderia gladioli]